MTDLRPARETDRDWLAMAWHEGASLPGVGPAQLPDIAALRARIDVEFAEGWEVIIAEVDGEPAGFLALRPDRAELDQLFIRPRFHGGGIGRALFARAITAMPDGFTLFTRPGNRRACAFYEAQGMTILRLGKHPRFGDDIVFYRWTPN